MEYDLTFLKAHGLMLQEYIGSLTITDTTVTFHYDRINRLLYLEPPTSLSTRTIINVVSQTMLVDYLWIWRQRLELVPLFDQTYIVSRALDEPLVEGVSPSDFRPTDLSLICEFGSIYHNIKKDINELFHYFSSMIEESPDVLQRLLFRFFIVVFLIRGKILRAIGSSDLQEFSTRLLLSPIGPDDGILRIITGDGMGLVVSSVDDMTLTQILDYFLPLSVNLPISLPSFAGSVLLQFINKYKFALHSNSLRYLSPRFLESLHETIILSSQSNRATGSYYTPIELAHYIASQTIARWLEERTGIDVYNPIQIMTLSKNQRLDLLEATKSIRVLDPAVGGGAFLVAAARLLFRLRRILGDNKSTSLIRREIIERNLFGVDILSSAVECTRVRLKLWAIPDDSVSLTERPHRINIKIGNSLVGSTPLSHGSTKTPDILKPFDWLSEFPEVFGGDVPGFDVILGNPPYGNITSKDERIYIKQTYPWTVSNGRDGTWNSASLFLVRTRMLLNKNGQLGFLVPNSILRVRQFAKTRAFIAKEFTLWEMVDEGSPFDGVTLESVTLMASLDDSQSNRIRIVSRRKDLPQARDISRRSFEGERIMVIYRDAILDIALSRGKTGVLYASRGRDIPKGHYQRSPSVQFPVPYAAVGRSIGRFTFVGAHMWYADDWFEQDNLMRQSYSESFLVATKNLPYPRCTVKPPGVLYGGGVVRIRTRDLSLDPQFLAVILNSRFIKFLCLRYFTNYSQLTTCLNTGIVEEIPIISVRDPTIYAVLFEALKEVQVSGTRSPQAEYLSLLADALVYELYLTDSNGLHSAVDESLAESNGFSLAIMAKLRNESVHKEIERIMSNPFVQQIEASPRMERVR